MSELEQHCRPQDDPCCIHPCPALECPEPICLLDFPGYKPAYDSYLKIQQMLSNGYTTDVIAIEIRKSRRTVQRIISHMRKSVVLNAIS